MTTATRHGDLVASLTESYEYTTKVWVLTVNGTPSARRLREVTGSLAEEFVAQRIEVLGQGPVGGDVEHLTVEVYGSLGKDVRASNRYVMRSFRSDNQFDGSYLFDDAPAFVLDILRQNLDLPILAGPDADHDDCEH